MTLGSASPGRSASATQRMPAGAARARRHFGDVDRPARSGKCVKHVRHDAGQPPPLWRARDSAARAPAHRASSKSCDHVRRRHLGHAAEQSLGRAACAPARDRRRAPPRTPRRAAACPSRFGALRGKRLRIAAPRAPRRRPSTDRARRPASSACRWWRRGPSSPARSRRPRVRHPALCASRRISGLAAGSSSSTANSRAITRSTLPSTAHRAARRRRSPRSPPRCRRRCRAARAELGLGRRETAAVPRDHRPARRRAGCARARSSRARPKPAARRRAAPPPAPRTSGQRARKRAK